MQELARSQSSPSAAVVPEVAHPVSAPSAPPQTGPQVRASAPSSAADGSQMLPVSDSHLGLDTVLPEKQQSPSISDLKKTVPPDSREAPIPAVTKDVDLGAGALRCTTALKGQAASDNCVDKSANPWLIEAGRRHSHSNVARSASVTCFVGGVAEGTSEEELISAAFSQGVRIHKCHVLPKANGFTDCVAFKAFLHADDVDRAMSAHFWPNGIWCRHWRTKPSTVAQ